MLSHQLAYKLLTLPDVEILVSIDADNITKTDFTKVFGTSIIEVRFNCNKVELHFEECEANFILKDS